VTGQGRILLVEDDRFLRRVCETSLQQRGLTVASATNGEDGLRLAKERPFDLILLDWLMPRMPGIDVLADLKADAATREIPVLILSYSSREEDRRSAMDMGATGYFVKANLSLKALCSEIERLLA
jgi:two-component system, OmpR family, phosphate regulon response regulator PhoB